MTNLVLDQFGGMMPRYGLQKLPKEAAAFAENAQLLSGELRGIHNQQRVADLRNVPYEIKRIYRALYSNGGAEWITFPDETVDMVKGPLVNDAYDRFYITSEIDKPRMNTLSRLASGLPSFLLGIPIPFNIMNVIPDDSGSANITVSRAYTYTFVSAYGEEGKPAEAALAVGKDDDVWQLSNMDTVVPDAAERNITHKNIYRTVTAAGGGVSYHFVDQIPLAQATYNDNKTTDKVGANSVLRSFSYDPPPPDLIGIVAHPNGFLVGFSGRDIYFSEPYLPHAWPISNILSTVDPIKGLGIFSTSVAVCTSGFPYIAAGIRPDGMTLTKAYTSEPCIAGRRSIVSMPFGVYYPSDDGLFLLSPGGFALATAQLMTKREWQVRYAPWNLVGVRWQSQYVGFYEQDKGIMFSPDEPTAALVELGKVWEHSVMQADTYSGAVWHVKDNVVYEWNPAFGVPTTYTWLSKEFVSPKPVNFGACKFEGSAVGAPPPGGGIPPPGGGPLPPEVGEDYQDFNDQRIQYPLNPMNFHMFGRVRKMSTIAGFVPPPPILAENSQPFHKSGLFRTGKGSDEALQVEFFGQKVSRNYLGTQGVELYFRLYADGLPVYESQITDEGVYRLPAGYKAKRWQFEFIGTSHLRSFKIAETAKELERL